MYNVTFCLEHQVTGRILGPFWKKPATLDIPDIEAFPVLDSSARCPKFNFRYTVNVPAEGITGEAVLLLRIYTLDVNTGELIVVGNSIIRLFTENENEEVHACSVSILTSYLLTCCPTTTTTTTLFTLVFYNLYITHTHTHQY